MKKSGSITVYLSIILVGIILLINVVSESARISTVQSQSKLFTHMAADSVFAQYGRQIYQDYGVLLVWEKESVKEQISKYIQANINMADLNVIGSNLMGTNLLNIDVNEIEYATGNGGKKLIEQICSYMKYSEMLEAAEHLTEWFNKYKESSETQKSENKGVTDIVDKKSEELQECVSNISEHILKIKETDKLCEKLSAVSQKMEKISDTILSGKKAENVSKFLKEYRELITEFDKEADNVDSTIDLIEQYERKKGQLLQENGYTSDARDYIDDYLIILKNIKGKIMKINGLNVSEFSNIDSKNISTVKKAVEKAKLVENELQSLYVNKVTEEDKKNQSIYESAKAFLRDGFLSLIVEDISKISNTSISASNLPTKLKVKQNDKSVLQKAKDKSILALYSKNMFGNYVEPKINTSLKYEMEYIISGKYSDKDNLTETIEKLVAARNALNTAYMVTDSKKMAEISTAALSAAASLTLPFMEPIIKAVLIEAWSLAEAVNDVKALLAGNKVNLIKTKDNWKTSLTNFLGSGKRKLEDKKGLTYVQYCQILIMLQKGNKCIYRIMDLMQLNIQKRYNKNFLMSECFESIKFTARFETEPLFTAMPWIIGMLNNTSEAYNYKIQCAYEY